MLRVFFVNVVALALLMPASAETSSEVFTDYSAKTGQIVERLSQVSILKLSNRSDRKEILRVFHNANELIAKILNHPQISPDREMVLLNQIFRAYSNEFSYLASGFTKPVDSSPLHWHRDHSDWWAKPFVWMGGRAQVLSHAFLRDIKIASGINDGRAWRIPPRATPLVGIDSIRSHLLKSILKDLQKTFRSEFKTAAHSEEETRQAEEAIRNLVDSLLTSKPLELGVFHNWVRTAYIALAVYFVMNPIELWYERTEFGPWIFGALEGLFFLTMARVRKTNSGLTAFSQFQRLRGQAGLPTQRVGLGIVHGTKQLCNKALTLMGSQRGN